MQLGNTKVNIGRGMENIYNWLWKAGKKIEWIINIVSIYIYGQYYGYVIKF